MPARDESALPSISTSLAPFYARARRRRIWRFLRWPLLMVGLASVVVAIMLATGRLQF
jgi:cell division septal protein FtsQ